MSPPHVPREKKSKAIHHLEGNDYFQATVSLWPDVDRLDTSSRVEDVTSGKGPETFGRSRRFTIGCKCLGSVPRRTVCAGTAGAGESGSVTDHAPMLSLLFAVLGRKRESRFWKEEGEPINEKFSRTTHSSEMVMEVSGISSGDPIVVIVGRGAIRNIVCAAVLVLVHVWRYSIL